MYVISIVCIVRITGETFGTHGKKRSETLRSKRYELHINHPVTHSVHSSLNTHVAYFVAPRVQIYVEKSRAGICNDKMKERKKKHFEKLQELIIGQRGHDLWNLLDNFANTSLCNVYN